MALGKVWYETQSIATNTWTSDVLKDRRKLLFAHIKYTSDATAGQRLVHLSMKDEGGTEIVDIHSMVRQTASNLYHYEYVPGGTRTTTTAVEDVVTIPIPVEFIFLPNYTVTIHDETGVSAGDSFEVLLAWEDV